MKSIIFLFAASICLAATPVENWNNSCSKCHGPDGKGQTKMGKKLDIKDLTDAKIKASLKEDEMVKAIMEGSKVGEKERMKGFKDTLTPLEAKELAALILGFGEKCH